MDVYQLSIGNCFLRNETTVFPPGVSDSHRPSATVDGRHPAPVEVGSSSHYLQGFSTIPGGWPWDFWSINVVSFLARRCWIFMISLSPLPCWPFAGGWLRWGKVSGFQGCWKYELSIYMKTVLGGNLCAYTVYIYMILYVYQMYSTFFGSWF